MRFALVVSVALAAAALARAAGELPPDVEKCAPGEAKRLAQRFVQTFNARDNAALNLVFSPAPTFNWYSTGAPGARGGPAAYDRSTLLPYFRSRQRAGERLRLVRFEGGGNANGYSHFHFLLERRARTLRPTVYEGKGAAICAASRDTISVWSVGPRA